MNGDRQKMPSLGHNLCLDGKHIEAVMKARNIVKKKNRHRFFVVCQVDLGTVLYYNDTSVADVE